MKIVLISMPTASLKRPSLSLTQIRSVLQFQFGDRVEVALLYLNHDFVVHLANGGSITSAVEFYDALDDQRSGLGDWYFRQEAFPEQADNFQPYFRRFFPGTSASVLELRNRIMEKRRGLADFLEGAIDRYHIDEADVVGFTSSFWQTAASIALARRIKQRNPRVVVVMGGANCETPMGESLIRNATPLDYVFSGPALKSFPQFIAHCLDGEMHRCEGIPGVFSRSRTERAPHESVGEELHIDEDIPLDFDDYFASFDSKLSGTELRRYVMFETSRGCWWGERSHCTFCGLNSQGMDYRAMSPDKAVTLINSLIERYASKTSHFAAVDNILPKSYFTEVLPRIERRPGIELFYEVRSNMGEDDVKALAAAGVTTVQPGIESLATSTLKLMRKGVSALANIQFLKYCVRHGVMPEWNLLVGFPGESEDVFRKYIDDFKRLAHLTPPRGAAAVRFDRFSPYFMNPKDFGLSLRHADYYDFIYPFDEESRTQLAYFFANTDYKAPYLVTLCEWFGKLQKAVQSWRDGWESGNGTRPNLHLATDGTSIRVRDSRNGSMTERVLTPVQQRILDFVDTPRAISALEPLGAEESFDARSELEVLDQMGLVWLEGDRAVSLVTHRIEGAQV